jgi:serine-type D-Ala-D-Ala carboxypeptidase/endopeptidase (penicillin-binding protein 4)
MRTLVAFSGLLLAPLVGGFTVEPAIGAEPAAEAVSRSPAALDLAADLNGAIRQAGWRGDRWGVLVVSLDAGDTLFAHSAEEALTPASNLKLFTSAAALHYLGPEYRYTTYLVARGPIRDGTLEGDLVVYGTGDPTFSTRFFESREAIWESLADSLAAAGVERVAGQLVGDASHFEGPAVGRGWQLGYATHAYAAPASALSYNENLVTLRVRPGRGVGDAPDVLLIPNGAADLQMEVRTVASGRSWIAVERESYEAPVVVTGQVQRGHAGLWRSTPVVDPAHFAVSVFADILASRGIEVEGGFRSLNEADASPIGGRRVFAPTLDGEPVVQVLAVHRSIPMLEILKVVNQRSHNLYAESVLRTVGRVTMGRGSAGGGAAAVVAMLEEAGISASSLVMEDGSGLSRLDAASPRIIVDLLAHMARSPHAAAFQETLPEAATSQGLRRMQRTAAAGNLRAKTGTIDGVSALSGYVVARNGERLAFAIIANDVPSTWGAKRIEDRIGARLASFDRALPFPGARATPAVADGSVVVDAGAADAPVEAARAYTIRSGDTLEGIARRHGVTVAALRAANPGVRDRRLIPGRTLNLPGS